MIKNYIYLFAASLGFANVTAQVQVTAEIEQISNICQWGSCVQLQANYTPVNATTDYTITQMQLNNSYGFAGGTVIPPTADDKWSSVIDLPFNFCFYGVYYNKLLVGTNGVVTFNLSEANNQCPYQMGANPIPNPNFIIRNAIYGVYQDITLIDTANPFLQNVNYYIAGTAPNRYFVINYNELLQFQCETDLPLQTSQIVLYETSNIVDVNVKTRVACNMFNSGRGLIGLQNGAGTLASVPEGRNVGNWSATNVTYRFTPNGAPVTSFQWLKNGEPISETSNLLTVCPQESETYGIAVSYNNCSPTPIVITDTTEVDIFIPAPVGNPENLSMCVESIEETAVFDLTANTSTILGSSDPFDYEINYYLTYLNAMYDLDPIAIPQNYTGYDGQVIYVRIMSMNLEPCPSLKSFTLHISSIPEAPVAEEMQEFTAGETLSDLTIQGDNILWYATETGGEPLPASTLLVHATTYYATQTNSLSGCESARMAQSRVAVTVYDEALGNQHWEFSNLKVLPNPFTNVINVKNVNAIQSVSVYNLIGQQVFSKVLDSNEVQLNMDTLSAGTYLMKIQSANQVKTVKIIKR